MIDDLMLADMIGRLYDAALGDEAWTSVVGRLMRLLGGDCIALHPTPRPTQPDVAVRVDSDPDYIRHFNAYFHTLWPIRPLLPQLQAGSVFVDRMLIPDAEYIRTEFYNDYVRPQDRHSGLSWVNFDDGQFGAHLSVWRSRRRPDWWAGEMDVLRRLGPHLGRALQLRARLPAEDEPGEAGEPVLTPREMDCLGHVARGASSKRVAQQLGLSAHTVNEYVESAMRKLGAATRTEAVARAVGQGLLRA